MILLLWVVLYGILFTLGGLIDGFIGVKNAITAPVLLIYALALVIFLNKRRKKQWLYGYKLKARATDLLIFLPLLSLPIINLATLSNEFSPFTLILLLSVAIIEEIFFRDFLFLALNARLKTTTSVIACSLIFALLHAANALNGLDLLFIITQAISAFAVGVCFSAITIKFNSILPSTLLHIAINLTGLGALRVSRPLWAILIGSASLIYLGVGLALILRKKKFYGV